MAGSVLLTTVAPALGCIVAWAMFLSPLRAVLQVRKSKAIGAFNPLPLVAMWANCAGWLVYSYLTRDIYVLASNEPGLILATFMTITCYGFADEKARERLLTGVLFFSLLLSCAGAFITFGGLTHEAMVSTWGFVTVAILLIFYAAPLSSIAEVLSTRSSAALNEPLAFAAIVNGALWAAYGWAVADPFIWAPNFVGAAFGLLQVALCKTFPSKASDRVQFEEGAALTARQLEVGAMQRI
ncbi:hypothetical protein Rsub_09949 [Raphidocelis subcapitata]|uniref:Bidirectional sugar transporter SWEET n=1 Tax=Raphidocelis subcapitata TaxID=307507 RepID=A0A2V0PBM0_9CHLO|nr:hypothetical protein Rsub_09949 [Raphidocelis subcapitata]|eukprot:GBF97258.1 hypothetical protein Rsub_09949 [Raphidocelis subcapitata]